LLLWQGGVAGIRLAFPRLPTCHFTLLDAAQTTMVGMMGGRGGERCDSLARFGYEPAGKRIVW
jgi:hypothetical protein